MKKLTKNLKKITALYMAVVLVFVTFLLGGCNKNEKKPPTVRLSLWCSAENINMVKQLLEDFQEQYKSEAVFNIILSEEDEITCKDTVLANPKNAADVFMFASDQFEDLYRAGALLPVSFETDRVIEENGGKTSSAVTTFMRYDKLYAFPATAGNGYFLYYNKNYFTEEDVKSLDRILEVAAQNNKKFSMDFKSGWYIYSFFKGAGLNVELNDNKLTNSCDWNSRTNSITGVDVTQAMLDIASHKGFFSCGDEDFIKGVRNGDIIAGVNGAWNAKTVKESFGDGYAATKLPEYSVGGQSVQMSSFMGYKAVGVNAYTGNEEWAMKLARFITNEESQLVRFENIGDCPSNVNAMASEAVKSDPAVSALAKQSKYAYLQDVAETFWTPAYTFGTIIAAGNPDGTNLQELLDDMVEQIERIPEEKPQ